MRMYENIVEIIRHKMKSKSYRMTLHAQRERFNDMLDMEAIEEVLLTGRVIEDYPEDKRGHSCLVFGVCEKRPIHVVVAGLEEGDKMLVIITVYRPDPEEWELGWCGRRTVK